MPTIKPSSRLPVMSKKRLDIIYRNQPSVLLASFFVTLLVIWLLQEVITAQILLMWFAIVVISIMIRVFIWHSYNKKLVNESRIQPLFWQRLFLFGTTLAGVVWGISGWYFLSVLPQDYMVMVLLVYGGLVAGSTLAHCYIPIAFYLFTSFSMGPIIVWLLSGNEIELQLGIFICANIFFLSLFYHRLASEFSRVLFLESTVGSLETELEDKRKDLSIRNHHYASVEDKYQQLVENASDLIFRTNENGNYIYVNHECTRVSGYSREELLQKNYLDLIHPEHRQRVKYNMLRLYARRQGGVLHIDFPIVTAKGNNCWLSQNTQLITIGNKDTYEFQGIARDISHENSGLVSLENARINESQVLAAKNEFINHISHELRTPLHVINGAINLLEESELGAFQKKQIDILSASSNQMLTLINDILDLSRIEKKQIEFIRSPLSVTKLMQEVILTFEQLAKEKELELKFFIDESIPDLIIGDYYRLLQILVNLVSNAIKYTLEGKITVSIKQESDDATTVALLFNVSDTGIGIPAHELDNVFEKFQQTRYGAEYTRAGTGLGLPIVKNLVEMQGGTLSVNSVVNRGSSFSFSLSFDKAVKTINDPLSESGAHAILTDTIDGRPVHILIADDNKMVRSVVISQMRQFWGKKVVIDSAEHGQEAVELAEKNAYDVILMDLQMPVMDGKTAVTAIRDLTNQSGRAIIIALSATNFSADDLTQYGFDDSIPKPFRKESLIKKLNQWLQQHKTNQQNSEIVD